MANCSPLCQFACGKMSYQEAAVTQKTRATWAQGAFVQGGWGTVDQAGEYMGISVVAVRREIRRGRLRAYRVGGRKLLRLKKEHCAGRSRVAC